MGQKYDIPITVSDRFSESHHVFLFIFQLPSILTPLKQVTIVSKSVDDVAIDS